MKPTLNLTFSIITINLNNKNGLTHTIKSVINQTYNNFEYIVIDGASTDGSQDVIRNYQDRIDYWVSEPDSGIYQAMNKGIKASTGEFLLFLNSGDYLASQDILYKVGTTISPQKGIWSGECLFTSGTSSPVIISPPEEISLKFLLFRFLPHQSTFIHRNLFDLYGLYNEENKLISDWEFFLKVFSLASDHKFYAKIDYTISVFDTQGISSKKESAPIIKTEKEKALNRLFGPTIKDFLMNLLVENNFFYNRRFILLKKIENSFLFRNLLYQIMKFFSFFIK